MNVACYFMNVTCTAIIYKSDFNIVIIISDFCFEIFFHSYQTGISEHNYGLMEF